MERGISPDWGWINVLYTLSNDNILNVNQILNLNLKEVLTFLSWSIEKNKENG